MAAKTNLAVSGFLQQAVHGLTDANIGDFEVRETTLFARAHLRAQGSNVHRSPVLNELAILDAEDVDESQFHSVAGRRQVPYLPTVGAAQRLAVGHQVPVRELLVDLHRGIWERPQQHPVERLEAPAGRGVGGIGRPSGA